MAKPTKPQQPATAAEQSQPPAFEKLERAHTALARALIDKNLLKEQIEAAFKELSYLAICELSEDLRVQVLTKGACMADTLKSHVAIAATQSEAVKLAFAPNPIWLHSRRRWHSERQSHSLRVQNSEVQT